MRATSRLILAPCAALATLLAVPAMADVKAGVEAWTRGEFEAAVAQWQTPAARGDADAQFNLGQAYKLGRGVKQDLVRAEELFGQAAAKGHMQASDNYGLLLFQRGERAKALPYISAASDRGDPRAQYLLGIANFNGDNVPKDWVRAYALVSLAQQAGLPQAASALSQMDRHIPIEQRQRSVALAQELKNQSDATRARQMAAADLGSPLPNTPAPPMVTAQPRVPPPPANPSPPVVTSAGGPRQAGADYARPVTPATRPVVAAAPAPRPPVAVAAAPTPVVRPPLAATPVVPAASGAWRVQLGAFGVAANADALWSRVKDRPELAGKAKQLVPAGKVTKLQARGFASQAAAEAACGRLSAGGFACIAVAN